MRNSYFKIINVTRYNQIQYIASNPKTALIREKKNSLERVNEYAERSTCRATLKLDDIKRLRVSEIVSYAENFEPTKVCMALLQIFPQQPSVSCQVLSCRVMFFAIMSGTLNMDITWLQLIIQMALKFSRSISGKKIDGTEI